jgi:hypothetical protein
MTISRRADLAINEEIHFENRRIEQRVQILLTEVKKEEHSTLLTGLI